MTGPSGMREKGGIKGAAIQRPPSQQHCSTAKNPGGCRQESGLRASSGADGVGGNVGYRGRILWDTVAQRGGGAGPRPRLLERGPRNEVRDALRHT